MAKYTRERRKQIKAGMEKARREGRVTGRVPYGWDRTDAGELVENKAEQAVLVRIGNWKRRGTTLKDMARLLNKDGVLSKSGGKWYPSSVSSVIETAARQPRVLPKQSGEDDGPKVDRLAKRKVRKKLLERVRRAKLSGDPLRHLRAITEFEEALGNSRDASYLRSQLNDITEHMAQREEMLRTIDQWMSDHAAELAGQEGPPGDDAGKGQT